MRQLLVLFSFLCFSVLSQIPSNIGNINPSNLSNKDLKQYGVSQNDIDAFVKSQKVNSEDKKTETSVIKALPEKEESATQIEESIPKKSEKVSEVFGHNFFKKSDLSIFESSSHVKVSDNYVIGVGDQISVNIWGYTELSNAYTVGDDGSIFPKTVGKIFLNGKTFKQTKTIIKARFGKSYNLQNSNISIDVNFSKVIKVNLVGEVQKPGTYSVSGINSVFNVISFAGGLTEHGSVREILVVRNGKKIKTLDVYKFLTNPTYEDNFFLLNDDYILVIPAKKIVEIDGAVAKPGLYELKKSEGIKDLISFSGKLLPTAYQNLIQLQRFENDQQKLLDLPLSEIITSKKLTYTLLDGDKIFVNSISEELRGYVEIEGAINIPGKYQIKEGDKISDIISKALGLTYNSFNIRATIERTSLDKSKSYLSTDLSKIIKDVNSPQNIRLKEFDKIKIYRQEDLQDVFQVEILGEIRNPIKIDYSEGLTLNDLIFMAGGLKPGAANAKIEISRISNFETASQKGESTQIIIETVTVSNDLNIQQGTGFELKPYDVVYVRSTPDFDFQTNVIIHGEVKYPGKYTLIRKDETLKEVIERAGGFSDWASMNGATLYRKEGNRGMLVIDLDKLYKKNHVDFNYVLRPGDSLTIPKISRLISVEGEIEYQTALGGGKLNVPFSKGKRASYYINKYGGGFTNEANQKKVLVKSPSGFTHKTKNFLFFKVYPKVNEEDIITIYAKKVKAKKESNQNEIDWNRVIENTTIKITGVLTLWLLVNNTFGN